MVRGLAGSVKPGGQLSALNRETGLFFTGFGFAHVTDKTRVGGAELTVVQPRFVQAEFAIDGGADDEGVL
jgi:hypothetical protein